MLVKHELCIALDYNNFVCDHINDDLTDSELTNCVAVY